MAVLSALDPMDHMEAEATRGAAVTHLALFAEWRSMEPGRVMSLVLIDKRHGRQPFAVLGLSNTGQAGVAQAAMLARDHKKYARALAIAGVLIRRQMPTFCEENGIHRVEARAWADHPTASKFLTVCGFSHETDMPGFGANGAVTFRQFAWFNNCPKEI